MRTVWVVFLGTGAVLLALSLVGRILAPGIWAALYIAFVVAITVIMTLAAIKRARPGP